jgi:hypothetical protein
MAILIQLPTTGKKNFFVCSKMKISLAADPAAFDRSRYPLSAQTPCWILEIYQSFSTIPQFPYVAPSDWLIKLPLVCMNTWAQK